MMVHVLFLEQHCPPGFYFLFCSLSLLMFVFAETLLQLLCVTKLPVEVLPLQLSLPVPS